MIHICACAVPTCEGRALLVSQYDRWEVYIWVHRSVPPVSRGKGCQNIPFVMAPRKKPPHTLIAVTSLKTVL